MGGLSLATRFRNTLTRVIELRSFSLRGRIWLMFIGLVCFAALATTLTLVQQARTSKLSADIATDSHRQVLLGSDILRALSEIDRRARTGEPIQWDVNEFRRYLEEYTPFLKDSNARERLGRLKFRFDTYLKTLPGVHPVRGTEEGQRLARTNYEDVSREITSLMELNANFTFKALREINSWQENTSRMALYCLAAFVLLSMIAGYLVITAITRPLSSLVHFLDRVNVEDDLPTDIPQLQSNVPEISLVTKSFEQLLQRLRGYRALNVRRLLIEKRRADIIAASISDGIFLLRGDELLYVNPIGQRILNVDHAEAPWTGIAPVGLSLRALGEPLREGEDKGNRCARAILSAISQTMPVEVEVDQGDRKAYYLIQAHPISYDLIEQVEHSVKGPLEQILDRFQANTIVLAQDVTLVRESQEAKGHFLATLSHEIKTPVTSLTMATRLLSKMIAEIPNPSHRSLILTCVEDVDRLRQLLEDLLTISRFDAMIQHLEFQNIDLIKLLKNSVQSFQVQAREKGVGLTYSAVGKTGADRPPKNLMVPMDASKVAWAVSNLLTNALRHTPRGGSVDARVICSSDEWVEVRVKDTGPGIEHKRQSRIFDKFSPFYDIRVARSGSTGAGLSIAREIVSAHGGRIWVSSEPGQGAEFGFTLPLKRRQVEAKLPGSPQLGGLTRGPSSAESSEQVSSSLSESSVSQKPVSDNQHVSPNVKKGAASGASACS